MDTRLGLQPGQIASVPGAHIDKEQRVRGTYAKTPTARAGDAEELAEQPSLIGPGVSPRRFQNSRATRGFAY